MKDTLYYDKDWKECQKDLAFYYGIKDLDKNFSGIEQYYYLTGQKHSLKNILNGSDHGQVIWWFKNEQKWCEGSYKKGLKDGFWTYWYPNGNKQSEGFYKDVEQIDWKYWDEKGNRIYNYEGVDEPPLFEGAKKGKKSLEKLTKYLEKNTKYPKVGAEKAIGGRVKVYFVVDEEGNVTDVKINEGINYYLDEEAKKIIEGLPKWKPAVKDGKNVRVNFILPIFFKL